MPRLGVRKLREMAEKSPLTDGQMKRALAHEQKVIFTRQARAQQMARKSHAMRTIPFGGVITTVAIVRGQRYLERSEMPHSAGVASVAIRKSFTHRRAG